MIHSEFNCEYYSRASNTGKDSFSITTTTKDGDNSSNVSTWGDKIMIRIPVGRSRRLSDRTGCLQNAPIIWFRRFPPSSSSLWLAKPTIAGRIAPDSSVLTNPWIIRWSIWCLCSASASSGGGSCTAGSPWRLPTWSSCCRGRSFSSAEWWGRRGRGVKPRSWCTSSALRESSGSCID